MLTDLWLVAALLLLTMAAAANSQRQHRRQRELAQALRRAVALQADVARSGDNLARLGAAQKLAENVVAGGTATVRAVHQGIASIPFSVLESIPGVREPAKLVRGVHDLASNSVYDSITGVNRVVGKQIRKGLGQDDEKQLSEEESAPSADPTRKPKS